MLHLPLLQWTPMYLQCNWKTVAECSCTSVHIYVWMIVLCPSIWIVFYTLPQHLSGQLSVQFIFVFLSFLMPSTGLPIGPWTSSVLSQWQKGGGGGGASTKLRWSAFNDDGNRWKCFTIHFHPSAVINKTALNCIFVQLFFATSKCWQCVCVCVCIFCTYLCIHTFEEGYSAHWCWMQMQNVIWLLKNPRSLKGALDKCGVTFNATNCESLLFGPLCSKCPNSQLNSSGSNTTLYNFSLCYLGCLWSISMFSISIVKDKWKIHFMTMQKLFGL